MEENCGKCTKEKQEENAGKPSEIKGFTDFVPGDGEFLGRTKLQKRAVRRDARLFYGNHNG